MSLDAGRKRADCMYVDGLIPAIGDPDEPSGAATRSSGGRRVELPALGWLFAVAAALVLLARLVRIPGELPAPIAGSDLAAGLASGLLALLPAALLSRLPTRPGRIDCCSGGSPAGPSPSGCGPPFRSCRSGPAGRGG